MWETDIQLLEVYELWEILQIIDDALTHGFQFMVKNGGLWWSDTRKFDDFYENPLTTL